MLAWPTVLFLIAISDLTRRQKLAHGAAWLALTAGFYALTLWGGFDPVWDQESGEGRQLLNRLRQFLCTASGTIHASGPAAELIGAALITTLAALGLAARREALTWQRARPWLALGVYALLFDGFAGFSRAGRDPGFQFRWSAVAVMLPLAVILLATVVAHGSPRRGLSAVAAVVLGLVAGFFAVKSARGYAAIGKEWEPLMQSADACLTSAHFIRTEQQHEALVAVHAARGPDSPDSFRGNCALLEHVGFRRFATAFTVEMPSEGLPDCLAVPHEDGTWDVSGPWDALSRRAGRSSHVLFVADAARQSLLASRVIAPAALAQPSWSIPLRLADPVPGDHLLVLGYDSDGGRYFAVARVVLGEGH
jgi:hypothetical protein